MNCYDDFEPYCDPFEDYAMGMMIDLKNEASTVFSKINEMFGDLIYATWANSMLVDDSCAASLALCDFLKLHRGHAIACIDDFNQFKDWLGEKIAEDRENNIPLWED